jgi:hypothetical protein
MEFIPDTMTGNGSGWIVPELSAKNSCLSTMTGPSALRETEKLRGGKPATHQKVAVKRHGVAVFVSHFGSASAALAHLKLAHPTNALTRFAAEARYPGDIEPIIPEDVALAIETAEGVVEWARVQIREVSGIR